METVSSEDINGIRIEAKVNETLNCCALLSLEEFKVGFVDEDTAEEHEWCIQSVLESLEDTDVQYMYDTLYQDAINFMDGGRTLIGSTTTRFCDEDEGYEESYGYERINLASFFRHHNATETKYKNCVDTSMSLFMVACPQLEVEDCWR